MIKNVNNKRMAVALILLGLCSIFIEMDATFFVITLMFGLPLFFARENWIS